MEAKLRRYFPTECSINWTDIDSLCVPTHSFFQARDQSSVKIYNNISSRKGWRNQRKSCGVASYIWEKKWKCWWLLMGVTDYCRLRVNILIFCNSGSLFWSWPLKFPAVEALWSIQPAPPDGLNSSPCRERTLSCRHPATRQGSGPGASRRHPVCLSLSTGTERKAEVKPSARNSAQHRSTKYR